MNPTVGNFNSYEKCLDNMHRNLVEQYTLSTFSISWQNLNYRQNPHRIAIEDALRVAQEDVIKWLLVHGEDRDQVEKVTFIGLLDYTHSRFFRFCFVTRDGRHHDIFTDTSLNHTDDAERFVVSRLIGSLSPDTLSRLDYLKSSVSVAT